LSVRESLGYEAQRAAFESAGPGEAQHQRAVKG
jgi:hypothetical protein